MDFAGESLVADVQGTILVKADQTEQIVYADIHMVQSQQVRNSKPYTTLRRVEWYR